MFGDADSSSDASELTPDKKMDDASTRIVSCDESDSASPSGRNCIRFGRHPSSKGTTSNTWKEEGMWGKSNV